MHYEGPHDSGPQHLPPLLIADDRSDDPELRRLTVAGEIDGSSAAHLYEAVTDVLRRQRPRHIEINLRGVVLLDPSGIGFLLMCRADAERAACRLTLTDPHPRAYHVLRDAALTRYFGLAG